MKTILKTFSEHGTFVQPAALEYISSKQNPQDFSLFLLKKLKECPLVLTLKTIKQIESSETITEPQVQECMISAKKEIQNKLLSEIFKTPIPIKENEEDEIFEDSDKENELKAETPTVDKAEFKEIEIKTVKGWKPLAREYEPEVAVVKDITGKSTCEGTTQDFVRLFQDRFEVLRKIIRNQRREMINVMPLNRIKKSISDVQIIGIVKTVRTTTNGHRLIEVEDDTGSATAVALRGHNEAFHLACEVMVDEIIGIVGRMSKNGDLIIAQNIIFPDIKIHQEKRKAEVPICAAFLSDVHVGSMKFMEPEFNSFLRWINGNLGNSRQRAVASKIKYLIMPGDLVDGIGIYPNQEDELSISNIYGQYERLAKLIDYIPDHITMILQPGNHDAVRPAEPQPTFEKEIQDLFSGKHFLFIGNPCYFSLHGIVMLSYHGQSLLDFATNIQTLNYNEPTEVMKVMLRKRHLAPAYGGYTPLAPEHSDYMIIDKVPDIFVTGHVHTSNIDEYRGTTLINASSWQSQTSYQKMLNFVPDSAKLPIVNLKTRNATTMDFSQQMA